MPYNFWVIIQGYEVRKTGCFANVELIIWLLILGKLNQSPSISPSIQI